MIAGVATYRAVAEITGVPAAIVSTGSGREETIFREGMLAGALQPA